MKFHKKHNQEKRRFKQPSSKVHTYYTPSQQDRIDIDMSSRRSDKRTKTLKTFRSRLEYVAGIIFILVVFYMLVALRGQPLINVVNSSPGIDSARYSAKASELFSSSIFNSNKLTLQRSSIESSIVSEFPEIRSAEVRYSFVGRRPELYITVYKIPFIYESLGNRYSVSEVGMNVGVVTDTPTVINPLTIKDESGIQVKKGDVVLTSGDVAFMTEVKSALEQKGRKIEYIRISSVPREVYIKLTDVDYQIKMYLEDDALTQVGSFLATEKSLGEGGEVPTQYIDVRAGEKVYWL